MDQQVTKRLSDPLESIYTTGKNRTDTFRNHRPSPVNQGFLQAAHKRSGLASDPDFWMVADYADLNEPEPAEGLRTLSQQVPLLRAEGLRTLIQQVPLLKAEGLRTLIQDMTPFSMDTGSDSNSPDSPSTAGSVSPSPHRSLIQSINQSMKPASKKSPSHFKYHRREKWYITINCILYYKVYINDYWPSRFTDPIYNNVKMLWCCIHIWVKWMNDVQ